MRCQATVKFCLLFGTGTDVNVVGKRLPDRVQNTQPVGKGKVRQVRDRLINIHTQVSNSQCSRRWQMASRAR